MRIQLIKAYYVLLGGLGGIAVMWGLGNAIYFFTEVLPYRNSSEGERLYHAVDGGLAVGIITFAFLIPAGFILGILVALKAIAKK